MDDLPDSRGPQVGDDQRCPVQRERDDHTRDTSALRVRGAQDDRLDVRDRYVTLPPYVDLSEVVL